MKKILIAAKSDNDVLGYQGNLPWHLPADLAFFMSQIKDDFLLTGRSSYESPQGLEVFGNREDVVVVTRQVGYTIDKGYVARAIQEAFDIANDKGAKRLMILGGADVYQQTIDKADELIITEVHEQFVGDRFFPKIDLGYWEEISRQDFSPDAENCFGYSFVRYAKKPV
jgi:dihydrofolate reductase